MPTPFVIVWRYRVALDHRTEFEAAYGASGPWVQLFERSRHYLGTDLVVGEQGDYLTIDRWDSEDEATAFLTANRAEYDEIESRCADLTETEDLVLRGTMVSQH
ncbi:hypothetical protein [Microbacterium deminutum]|uniref:ABM domain-containing protein n=1 Tax=Microbacterium deminutum TaxID=344164 RepID=A0ABN2QX63_9MICO